MTTAEIETLVAKYGQPKFRAKQIFKWLHQGVKSFDEMTDISKDLRASLANDCYIASVSIERKLVSKIDGTVKYLYKLHDGEYIESVLMKYEHGYTVCISTQVGCRMGCKFCASGINGLTRNLTASEMLTAQATADAARADFRRVVRIDNDGLHVGDNQSSGEVLIDSESVNVVMNGNKYSRFAGNYVQFGNYQLRRTTDGGLAFKITDI